MITCTGQRGHRSKTPVRLSVDTFFGYVVLHVWEGDKITHTFHPAPDFLRAMQVNAILDLRMGEGKRDEEVWAKVAEIEKDAK